jgi:hypothetical protein
VPKMFIHASSGVFNAEARARVAAELTDLGMACERLANTPAIRSGVWVIFAEHEADAFFSGGELASRPIIALLINAIKGGLDDPAKKTADRRRNSDPRQARYDWPWTSACVRRRPGDSRDQLGNVRQTGRPIRDACPGNCLAAFDDLHTLRSGFSKSAGFWPTRRSLNFCAALRRFNKREQPRG